MAFWSYLSVVSMEHSVGGMAYGSRDHEPTTGAEVLDWALYE